MKAKEIIALSANDRTTKIEELYKELMKNKAQARGSTPKNPSAIRNIKRTIAQLKTVQLIKPTKPTAEAKK